jgi:hypothetical protein
MTIQVIAMGKLTVHFEVPAGVDVGSSYVRACASGAASAS